MRAPKSVKELHDFLLENPRIKVTGIKGDVEMGTFTDTDAGGINYKDDSGLSHYLPVDCHRTEAASKAEAGVDLDDGGFTLTKFGHSVRVDYVEEGFHHEPNKS